MKKFFRLVSMLAIAGATFAYTSCTDYDQDIEAVNNRIDNLETGRLKTAEDQIASLKSSVTALQDAQSKSEAAIKDLQSNLASLTEKHDKDIAQLKKDYEAADAALKTAIEAKITELTNTFTAQVKAINDAIDGLKNRVATLEAKAKAVEDLIPTLATLKYVDQTFATKDALAQVNTDLGKLKGEFESAKLLLDQALVDIDALEVRMDAAEDAIEAAQETASTALSTANAIKTALGVYAENGVLEAKIEALEDADATLAAGIADLEEKKLNIADFQGKFDEAFDAAIRAAVAEGGIVDQAIVTKVNAAKEELLAKINEVKEALEAKIAAVFGVVKNLAERVQSITFVPEYNHLNIEYFHYYVEDARGNQIQVSDVVTVKGTFEVFPKKYAQDVAASKDVVLVALPLKTKAANAAIEGTKVKMTGNNETGRVEVEYTFSAKDLKLKAESEGGFAVALRIEEPAVSEAEGESVDAGSYVESTYVNAQRDADASNLTNKYDIRENGISIYKVKSNGNVADLNIAGVWHRIVKIQWSEAPIAVKPHGNSQVVLKVGDVYLPLAEAAAAMNVSVNDIKPKFSSTYHKKDANTEKYISLGTVTTFNELEAKVLEATKKQPSLSVGQFSGRKYHTIVVEGVEVLKPFNAYVEITRRQVNFNVTPQAKEQIIPWTYSKAVELSNTPLHPNNAYKKDIVFEECHVDEMVEGVTLASVLAGAPTSTKIVNGRTTGTVGDLVVTKLSHEIENIAKVTVKGGTYKFLTTGNNTLTYTNVYALDGDIQTDFNVVFKFTLGQMPGDATIIIPTKELNYTAGSDLKIDLTDDAQGLYLIEYDKTYNGAKWFKTREEALKASVNYASVGGQTNQVKRNRPSSTWLNLPTSGYNTALNVRNGGPDPNYSYKVEAVLDEDHLAWLGDKFTFETTVETWYGPQIIYYFGTNGNPITVATPKYSLAPAPDRLKDDWTGLVNHKFTTANEYILTEQIDLSKCVRVNNFDGTSGLYVGFKTKTVENIPAGIVNVPAINTSVTMHTDATIPTVAFDWLTAHRPSSYTAREIQFDAILKYGRLIVDQEVITLTTADPVTAFTSTPIVKEVTVANAKVNLWDALKIDVVADPTPATPMAKFVTPATTVTAAMANYRTIFDADLTFKGNEPKNIYVGGVLQNDYNPRKFVYNPTDGTLTFVGDLTDLVRPVEFEIDVDLTYVLDYNNVQKKTQTVKVTFKKAE